MDRLGALGPNEARVLQALLRTEAPMTGRAVARVTGLPQSTAQRALTRLREAGLLMAAPVPPSVHYWPNPEHLAMPAVLALLRLGDELRRSMIGHVAAWRPQPLSVIVYGSIARGDATTSSDVDVLVVRPDAIEPDEPMWQHKVAALGDRIHLWTGRRASVVDISRDDAVRGLADGEPYLVEADRDGWLIAGQALRELAEARR